MTGLRIQVCEGLFRSGGCGCEELLPNRLISDRVLNFAEGNVHRFCAGSDNVRTTGLHHQTALFAEPQVVSGTVLYSPIVYRFGALRIKLGMTKVELRDGRALILAF
jgi:hypothetical protein